MQALGATLRDILSLLVEEAESVSHGEAVCSVLLIDEEGLLRNGASPGLPDDCLAAIDRLKPDARIGTCAPRPSWSRSKPSFRAAGTLPLTPPREAS
jgi:hypothetical protein